MYYLTILRCYATYAVSIKIILLAKIKEMDSGTLQKLNPNTIHMFSLTIRCFSRFASSG